MTPDASAGVETDATDAASTDPPPRTLLVTVDSLRLDHFDELERPEHLSLLR